RRPGGVGPLVRNADRPHERLRSGPIAHELAKPRNLHHSGDDDPREAFARDRDPFRRGLALPNAREEFHRELIGRQLFHGRQLVAHLLLRVVNLAHELDDPCDGSNWVTVCAVSATSSPHSSRYSVRTRIITLRPKRPPSR